MARTQKPPPNSTAFLIVTLLLAALIVAAYLYYVQHQTPVTAADSSPDLITENRIIYGGTPRAKDDAATFEILKNAAYIVGYSESRKDPLWSAYRVIHIPTPYNDPRPAGFHPDPRTSALAKESDYTRSGYQRGHMAPNASIDRCYGPAAQFETFLMSNICPQTPPLNERVWERLEADERQYADRMEEVWVVDGPIFGDLNGATSHTLPSGEAIPQAFYKILLDEDRGHPRVFAVIMPQQVRGTELPQQFLTSIQEIENQTHLEFLWKLDPATQQELKSKTWPMW